MGDDDDLVAAVDELGGELVNMGFDAARLWEEEVADHGDVVGHCEDDVSIILYGMFRLRYYYCEG